MELVQTLHTIKIAESCLRESEYSIPSEKIFDIISKTNLSSYDAEYVAPAGELNTSLVTNDKRILTQAGKWVLSMKDFVD